MRLLAYIIEILVIGFMTTTFIFMSKQPVINEVEVKQEADSTSSEILDNLDNLLLEEDTTAIDSTTSSTNQ